LPRWFAGEVEGVDGQLRLAVESNSHVEWGRTGNIV
jgi:hypothetical protein